MMKFGVWVVVVGIFLGATFAVHADSDEKGPVAARMVTVPNVCGKLLTEAIAILSAAGLNRQTQLSDRDGERRIVIRQEPAAGTMVARGTTVKIFGQLASLPNGDNKGPVTLPRR
jgi:beta-lactam-binding protein with PASTA domain